MSLVNHYDVLLKEKLIKINHALLDSIGVGHTALTEVVSASSSLGFTSKLTGAGGGGCAITLLDANPTCAVDPQKLSELCEVLRWVIHLVLSYKIYNYVANRSKGFKVFRTAMGGDGIRWL